MLPQRRLWTSALTFKGSACAQRWPGVVTTSPTGSSDRVPATHHPSVTGGGSGVLNPNAPMPASSLVPAPGSSADKGMGLGGRGEPGSPDTSLPGRCRHSRPGLSLQEHLARECVTRRPLGVPFHMGYSKCSWRLPHVRHCHTDSLALTEGSRIMIQDNCVTLGVARYNLWEGVGGAVAPAQRDPVFPWPGSGSQDTLLIHRSQV